MAEQRGCAETRQHTFAVLLRIQRCIQQLGNLDIRCHVDFLQNDEWKLWRELLERAVV